MGLCCLALVYCNKTNPTTPQAPSPSVYPNIVFFTINPKIIKRGISATLSWKAENATAVEIDQGIGGVALGGQKEINPIKNTEYIITARNNTGSVIKSCSVIVENGAIPHINLCEFKDNRYFFAYSGTIINYGTYTASYVKICVSLYGNNGNLLIYDWIYIDKIHLEPSKTSTWEIVFQDAEKKIRVQIARSDYKIMWEEF